MEARGGGSSLEEEEEKKKWLVQTFVGTVASTREEALFFLESYGWDLDSAIVSFYDHQADPQDHRSPLPRGQDDAYDTEGEDEDYLPPEESLLAAAPPPRVTRSFWAAGSRGDKKESKPSGSRVTIRTLADLNRRADPGSDSDSDGPQEYYTGGEKSGMLVQDPSKGGNNANAVFVRTQRIGVVQGPLDPQPSSSSSSFTGTGRLLSSESVPSAPAPRQPENIVHNIYFWRNGFTVNDGSLRRFEDRENDSFLEELVRHPTAFQGVGRTLGGGSSDNLATVPNVDSAVSNTAAPSFSGLSVGASLSSTSIQLRLADGTSMVARFNMHHTVGHIRAFMDASWPGSSRTYQLQMLGFPHK